MSNNYSSQEVNDLVHSNMGLVVSLAKSLRPPNQTEFDEYIQLGRIGLWKAIEKHDPSRAKLSTIAWSHIRWEIIRYITKCRRYNDFLRSEETRAVCELTFRSREALLETPQLDELLPTTLSRFERTVMLMRHQGYTFQEIGESLGGYPRWWANKLFKSAIKKTQDANEETHTHCQ